MDSLITFNRYKNITQRLRILILQNIHEEDDYDTSFLLEINRLSLELLNLKRAEKIEKSRAYMERSSLLVQSNDAGNLEAIGV